MPAEVIDVNNGAPESDADEAKRRERGDYFEGSDDDDNEGKDAGEEGGEGEEGDGADASALAAIAGEDEGEEGEGAGKGSPVVPHARFNEVNEKAIGLAAENRLLKEQLAARGGAQPPKEEPEVPAFNVRDARKKVNELLSMGEEDQALDLQDKIDEHIAVTAAARARTETLQEVRQDTATRDLNAVAAQVMDDHPWLNEKGKEADPRAIKAVVAARNEYIREGHAPAAALRKAAADIAELRGTPAGKKADDDKGNPDKTRNENALTRGARASGQQPPTPNGGKGARGGNATPTDVANMTDEQFAAMPKEERRRLRGDDL